MRIRGKIDWVFIRLGTQDRNDVTMVDDRTGNGDDVVRTGSGMVTVGMCTGKGKGLYRNVGWKVRLLSELRGSDAVRCLTRQFEGYCLPEQNRPRVPHLHRRKPLGQKPQMLGNQHVRLTEKTDVAISS